MPASIPKTLEEVAGMVTVVSDRVINLKERFDVHEVDQKVCTERQNQALAKLDEKFDNKFAATQNWLIGLLGVALLNLALMLFK